MELKEEQIERLYQFTRAHYVEWYDLQTELVDHLAGDIEHILAKDPELSFEEALHSSFKKFGVFGFSDIVEKKQNALSKYYWRLAGKYFIQYLRPPKILLTLCLLAVSFSLLKWFEQPAYLIVLCFVVLYVFIFKNIYTFHQTIKRRTQETGRKWLFEHNILNLGGAVSVIGIPIQWIGFGMDRTIWTDKILIINSIFIVFGGLICYILLKVIPPKLTQEMGKLYPNYQPLVKI